MRAGNSTFVSATVPPAGHDGTDDVDSAVVVAVVVVAVLVLVTSAVPVETAVVADGGTVTAALGVDVAQAVAASDPTSSVTTSRHDGRTLRASRGARRLA